MPGRTLALIAKELRVLVRTPAGLVALLLPPLVQLLLFGYAATFDVDRVPMAIMNEDTGPHGRELAARFAGSPVFEVVAAPTEVAELGALLDRGAVVLALRIGQRFSADLGRAVPADVQIVVDGRLLNTALTVQGYATSIVAAFNREQIVANGLPRPAALTVTRAWFNPELLSHWYVIPGLVAKVLMVVTLSAAALAVARERDLGTLERLLTAPLTPLEIVAGKAVPAFAIGFAQGLAMGVVAVAWFGVPFRGDTLLFALALAAMLWATVGVGLMISILARTQAGAILGTFAFVVPAVMLSGFATPIASMPAWIQAMTLVNPLRYAIEALRDLALRGSGWDMVWPQLWPMLAIGAASFLVGHRMLRRRLDRAR